MFILNKEIALLALASLFGCATIQNPGGPVASLLVKGDPQLMVAFNQALQPLIQGEPVGCELCDQLGTDKLVYTFFRDHKWLYKKFGQAWNVAQKQPNGNTVEMSFFTPNLTSPDCGPPLPQPCYTLAACTQYGGCTKDSTRHSCKKC
jgi:hypothetical protein